MRCCRAPFIPDAAARDAGGDADCDGQRHGPATSPTALAALPAGHAFTTPEVLFAKIADEEREDWAKRFSGVRRD